MSTVKKLAAKYDLVQQTPSDVDHNFSRLIPIVLGVLHIFFGLFSIALGIGSICIHASGYFIGYGIWCGFIFIVVGIVCMVNGCCNYSAMITTNMVFNIIACCTAIVQFSLGIVAAANDSNNSNRFSADLLSYRYDIYYAKIAVDREHCKGSISNLWRQWGAVDVLLILVGFFESVIAVLTVVICVRSICCGRILTEQVPPVVVAPRADNGYYNNGYHNDGYYAR
jgi:hypothetical protein